MEAILTKPKGRALTIALICVFFVNAVVAQTITINSTSRSVFCASTQAPLDINFTETGFTGNRTFTAQLSNSTGSFASPTTIGTVTFNTNNNLGGTGLIQATVNQPAGVYSIRVATTSGGVTTTSAPTCIAVYPTPPTLTAPANTCGTMFTLPAVPQVAGFNVVYSIDGGLTYSAAPSTTTPGCYNIIARYVSAAACGTAPAGRMAPATCLQSNSVNAVIFPAAPPAPTVNSGCGPIVVTPPPAVVGFTTQYSFDDGATWGANTPPTADNCAGYRIRTRYVLVAACGSTPVGTTAACATSPATIRRIDTQAPTLTTAEGADENIGCNPSAQAIDAAFDAPTFADNCGTPTVVAATVHAGTGCQQSDTRTWTATDACGNTTMASQTITYSVDTDAPTVATAEGADENIGCNPTTAAIDAAFDAPVFTDNCGTPPVTVATVHAGTGCEQSDTRTWTATDACGNMTAVSQTVSYTVDTQAPTLTSAEGGDENIGCNPTAQAVNAAFDAPAFADNCGAPTVVVTTAQTSNGCVRSDTRTWTATDACGNSTVASQTISYTVDTQAPVVATAEGADASLGCNPTAQQLATAFTPPTFTDNCGTPPVTVATVHTGTGCAQSDTRTWTATDACGNTTAVSQTVSYTVDTQAPVITCPPAITVQCASEVPAPNAASLTATDNCGGAITKEHVGDALSNQRCANRYTLTRTYSATDACGNSSTCTQIITVNDNTAPVVQNCPATITVAPTTLSGTVVNYTTPTATDNCGGNVTRTQTAGRPSGATFPIGTTTNTYEFTDACGNKSTCTFTVTVTNPYCDNNPKNRKVYVCHDGNTICISVNALQEHLDHGDYLGACTPSSTARPSSQQGNIPNSKRAVAQAIEVIFSPNPTTTNFSLRVESSSDELIDIRVFEATGKLMTTIEGVKNGSPVTFGDTYRGGIYFVKVMQGNNHKTVKVIKLD